MQSYSQDLRERVLWALGRGEGPTAIARRLEVSRVWVYQVRNREQQTGRRTSFQIGGHRRVPGWLRWSRCCAPGSQPSPILPWPNCANDWPSKAYRSRPAHCGIS